MATNHAPDNTFRARRGARRGPRAARARPARIGPTRRTCTSRRSGVCRPSPAEYAPFPDALDARLHGALAVARHRAALHAPGRSHRPRARRPQRRRRHADRVRARRSATTRPILHSVLQDPSSRALYLFPTKALAQDQLAELQGLCETLAAQRGERDRRLHLRRRHAAGCAAHASARARIWC